MSHHSDTFLSSVGGGMFVGEILQRCSNSLQCGCRKHQQHTWHSRTEQPEVTKGEVDNLTSSVDEMITFHTLTSNLVISIKNSILTIQIIYISLVCAYVFMERVKTV